MIKNKSRILFIIIFLCAGNIFAQINISSIGGSVGVMKNHSLFDFRNASRVYPKLELRGNFYKPYIGWKVFGGYWNDNFKYEDVHLSNTPVYSYKSYNMGFMFQFFPQKKLNYDKWGVGFNLGYSLHFSTRKYLGGINELGTDKSTLQETRSYIDGGVEIYFKLWEAIRPFIEFEGHLPLKDSQTDYQIYNLSVGLLYNFGS